MKKSATPAVPVVPVAAAGTKLLGEIITWAVTGSTIRHANLVAALRESGLDEKLARELAPRHAFSRACKKLSEARIIRQVDEDATTITFQFTKESKVDDTWTYEYETKLVLDKGTGEVACPLADLAARAQAALDECIAARTAGDVTTIIQRLFERQADLFKIREQGGCYFVPAAHLEFVARVQTFVTMLNGRIGRFPVPAGTPQGDRSVKDAVAEGLSDMIAEHRKSVEEFTAETKKGAGERAAERIRQTRFKLSAYAEYLGEEKARLEGELVEAAEFLRERLLTPADADAIEAGVARDATGPVGMHYLAECDTAWGMGETDELAVAAMRRLGRVKGAVAYKVWKVHPDADMDAAGKITSPAGAPEPELVREVHDGMRSLVG